MLEIDHLTARYGGITALDGVQLSVTQGEVVALLGSNGAGKSTLLGCITASAPCHSTGSIRFEGHELQGKPTEAVIRAGIVLVPEGRQLFGELTVMENLMMGAFLRGEGVSVHEDLGKVFTLFPVLRERKQQLAQTLSGESSRWWRSDAG